MKNNFSNKLLKNDFDWARKVGRRGKRKFQMSFSNFVNLTKSNNVRFGQSNI